MKKKMFAIIIVIMIVRVNQITLIHKVNIFFCVCFRLKFIDMHITLGKCSNVLCSLSRRVGVVRIVRIVLNPLDMTQD